MLKKMDESGVNISMDVHGDELLPFNFIAADQGAPNWGPRLESLHGAFLLASYIRANADMQAEVGYDRNPPMEGNLGIKKIDCLSMTLQTQREYGALIALRCWVLRSLTLLRMSIRT